MSQKYSIDAREVVTLGGAPQHIRIRGTREDNPVLLFLHGGPGVCDRHWVLEHQSGLADVCTLVCYDQRGAGKSYTARQAKQPMTLDQVVEDVRQLTEWLCERFGQDRIYIEGHSWGSILGTLFVSRHPEHVAAYIGQGQFVEGEENERLSYDFVVAEAERRGDERAQRELARIGAPVNGRYRSMDDMMVQRNYLTKFGGGEYRHEGGNIYTDIALPILRSPEYTFMDLLRYARGSMYCLNALWDQVVALNFFESVQRLAVPVYITQGDHDQNTPTPIARRWFDALEAPYKEWIAFHESAHSPIKEEPALWGQAIRERVFRGESGPSAENGASV